MIFHPANLALVAASLLTASVIVAAAIFALRLVRHWDLASGAERQIRRERTPYLVPPAVAFVLVVEAVTLVLFPFTADRMAALFVGAMCAVGTLNASVYGFPTLWAKIAVFFAASVWLVIDHVDNRGRDYPLIRIKYLGILLLAPLILAEAGLQLAYFLDLKADTITSCCGRLFGEASTGTGGDMASMDPAHALILLFGGLAAIGLVGLAALRYRAAQVLHGPASLAMFLAALAAVVSVIAPYVYEQPHHHCPFCILKPEYHHFGFALYLPLFLGTGAGSAAGVLALLPQRASLATVSPAIERRLVHASLFGFALFGAIAAWAIARSGLTLFS